MSSPSFEDLCRDLCDTAGLEPPLLVHDETGAVSLSFQINGIDITLCRVSQIPDGVLCLAALGPIPPGRELESCIAMLDANFLLRGHANMSFGCAPEGGEPVLQSTYKLEGITGASLLQGLVGQSELAHQWREGRFLAVAPAPEAGRVQTFD